MAGVWAEKSIFQAGSFREEVIVEKKEREETARTDVYWVLTILLPRICASMGVFVCAHARACTCSRGVGEPAR